MRQKQDSKPQSAEQIVRWLMLLLHGNIQYKHDMLLTTDHDLNAAKKDIGNALTLRCIWFTATGLGRDCARSVAASVNPKQKSRFYIRAVNNRSRPHLYCHSCPSAASPECS
jgi:hypothetical protein